jgi:small subunit ribosomal protein S9
MNTQSENISDINSKDIMYATGKRKTSIAKIWLKKGSGKIMGKILKIILNVLLI